jgi:hypothetical protein
MRQHNETVEKPRVRKMLIKISHNRLKNCPNVAKMLCGTPKTGHFSASLSHFSKIIFEKRLIRQFQRFVLLALGREWTLFGSRENSKPEKCPKMPQNPQRPVHLGMMAGDHFP